MTKMKLITPDIEIVNIFNSFWTDKPSSKFVKLFEDDEEIDISEYIERFKEYGKEDEKIIKEQTLEGFFNKINSVYHTRVSGIHKIVEKLNESGIKNKNDLEERIKNDKMNLPQFVQCCKEATGSYTYSFASKVFNFIDGDKYPIIDSFVATLLKTYEYDGIPKSKWGDYSQYIINYNDFKKKFGLNDLSFKVIDKFLWTYAKILSEYWLALGVLSYEPVAFDPNSLKNNNTNMLT